MPEKDRYIGVSMGLDIQALQLGLREARSEMSLANSEFGKQTAGLGKWSETAQGVAEKVVALATEITSKQKIVENYRNQLQLVADAYGEDSEKAKALQKDLNNAEKDLRNSESAYNNYTKKLEALSDADTLASQGTVNLQNAIERLNEHVVSQKTAIESTKNKLEEAKRTYGDTSPEVENLTRKLELQEGQLDILETTLGSYKTALDKCDQETGDLDSSTGDLAGGFKDVDSAASNLTDVGLEKLKVKMENLRDRVFSQMMNKVKDLATGMVNLGIDFTGTMSEVQAISGATKEEMEALTETAREYGATTTFSATESAQALKYMALAGWDTQQSTEALGGVLDLAASSSMDLGKASDMVTDYITAFGLEAQDAGRFADMLAYAQGHANTTAEGLGEAFKNSAAVMTASGQTVETTTAFLSKMADAGLKGSNAGTALSAVVRDMTQKMKDGSIKIGETSVAVADADGNFRSLTDIILDVESAVDGMGTAEKATALQTTFTADSIKGLNLILGQGAQSVKDFEGELSKSDGTAKNMAETMNDNLGGDIKKLKSAFEELQLKLFDMLEGPLRGIVDFITNNLPLVITLVAGVGGAFATWKIASVLKDMVTGFKAVIPVLQTLTSTTALSTAGEIAHTAATTAMTAAQGLATAATTALSGAMAFLAANPIVLVVAAIAGLVAALIWLWDNCEEFRDAVEAIWNAICGFFEWAAEEILKAWDSIVEFFEGVWNGIQEVFGGVGDFFGDVANGAVEFFEDPWGSTVDFFGGIWDGIQDAFSGVGDFFSDVGKTANDFFQDPWGTTQNFFEDTVSTVKNCFVGVAEFFGINGEDAVKAFEWAWDTVKGFFDGIVEGIETIFGGITDFFGSIGNGAVKVFEDPWGSVTGFFGGIWDGIKGAFSGVADFFGGVFDGAVNGIKSAFSGIKSFFEGIWNGIVGFFKPILSIFGINLDSGTDTKLKEYEDKVARLKEQTNELASIRDKRATDYNTARQTYGYFSSNTDMAYNAYKLASSQYADSQNALNKVQAELDAYKNSKNSGSGGFIGDLTKSIKDGLTNGLAGIGDIITKPFKAAWDGITNIFGGIGDWFNKNVLGPVGDALGGLTDAVGDIVGGVAEGIGQGANDVLGGVQKFGEDVYNGFCSFFGIHSPSKLMRDKVGKMISSGIGEGINLGGRDVLDSIRSLGKDASNALSISGSSTLGGVSGGVIFNQTINSPEPLTTGQIYRDTKSLIGRRIQG